MFLNDVTPRLGKPFSRQEGGLFVMCLILVLGCACSIPRVQVGTENGNRVEYGLASWYGKDFHGRLTANGEVYDMYKPSAAHKTLPLGTKVKVTSRKNGKTMVVRINDRGPFVRGRIIDLSYAAAATLGMVEEGVVPVRVETIELGDNRYMKSKEKAVPSGSLIYTVQVGSFQEEGTALHLKRVLEADYAPVFIQVWNDRSKVYYRVRVGKYTKEEDARELSLQLQQQNFTAFVTAE
jgi:rare lipoprotein A